jgi:hypothetical protein
MTAIQAVTCNAVIKAATEQLVKDAMLETQIDSQRIVLMSTTTLHEYHYVVGG